MIALKDKSNCNGCSACKNICPKGSIEMRVDCEGFSYPVVNTKTCVDCSLCEKICPVTKSEKTNSKRICYAAYSKDEEIRKNSSSGGVFSVLALNILQKGGVVFGAAFENVTKVKHIYIDNEEDLYKLRTSKYIQSEIGNSYKKAKEFLDVGRPVLFTGTPCQIAGLKSFLGKEYDNLYTQDVICHGVPSNTVWQKYIGKKQNPKKGKLKFVNFRSKEYGWKDYSVCYDFGSFNENTVHGNDLFIKAFLKNIILRPSCYTCKFKGNNYLSDITLGDFWGIDSVLPEMDDNRGTSLVICNTGKGNTLFNDISHTLIFKKIDYSAAVGHNPAAVEPVSMPGSRKVFFNRIRHHSITKELELFCGDDKKSVKKVQLFEDCDSIKKEKGRIYSLLWLIKNKLIQK